jgi:GntR family transcriptional repressor for pyruvate dehydrogenase complex
MTDAAITQLRTLIAEGDLAAGERLPAEPDLAAQLGVSRGTMREAVRALTHAGILSVKRGDGTYVTSLEPHQLLESLGYAAQLARHDSLLEVVEVRRLLEPAATRLAAKRMGTRVLGRVAELLGEMDDAESAESFVALDVAFHNEIADASGNEWLAAILHGLAEPTISARLLRLVRDPSEVTAVTQREHAAIYAALAAADEDLAAAAALTHVCTTQYGLRAMLAPAPLEP